MKKKKRIRFEGCNYDCFNCIYEDCKCPAVFLNTEKATVEEQMAYIKKRNENAVLSQRMKKLKQA